MGAKSGTQTDWCTQPGLSLIQRGLVEKHKTETCLEGIGSVPDGIEPVQLKKSERPERLRKSQAYYRRCLAFFLRGDSYISLCFPDFTREITPKAKRFTFSDDAVKAKKRPPTVPASGG